MLSVYFYIFFIVSLTWLLWFALGLSCHTLAVLFKRPVKRLWFKTLVVTFFIVLFISTSRLLSDELYRVGLNYLGLVNYSFFLSLLYWLPALFYRIGTGQWFEPASTVAKRLGIGYIVLVIFVVGYAVYNFHKPLALVELDVRSEKIKQPLSFIHISDMQYGTTSRREMVERLERVYALAPEFIVFTGDLIDFEGYKTEDFKILAQSPVPIFFERGNHEFYHDPTRLLSDLNQIETLRLLLNQKESVGQVDIVGIDFGRDPDHLANQLNQLPLDPERFSILLYHEPIDIEVGVQHGFDLLLYGHTHGGQIWPYTWLIDWMYRYGDGLFKVDDAIIYTSDGLSLWGPRMRLGSQNEIVIINLLPE